MSQGTTAAGTAGPRIAPIRLFRRKLPVLRDLAGSLLSVMVPLSLIIFTTGYCADDLNTALVATVLMFVANIVFGCMRLRERILFLFLHAGIALFLLTRPVIGAVNPTRSWFLGSMEATWFAIGSIFVSLVFLFLGAAAYTAVCNWNAGVRARRDALRAGIPVVAASGRACPQHGASDKGTDTVVDMMARLKASERVRYIRTASLLVFLVCFAAGLYEGSIKLSYMEGLAYEEYYLIDPDDHIPWIIGVLEPMMLFSLCSYLACMPRRRPAVICLAMYVLTTVPMLMIGSRSEFVITFLFGALYFILRAMTDTEERWITKRLIAVVCIAAPVGIFAMGAMNYTRAGSTIDGFGFMSLISDALFKQGVSFTVLGHGYDVDPQIQELGFRFFSIGGIISTITQGFIGQTFLGCPDLGSTNSAYLALNGTSYAHAMSFFAHPNYLGGEGYGSSYILELYADFGFAGIVVGSFILGASFSLLSTMIGRRWFGGMVALTAASYVFHMPRGYFIEWIDFIISTRFLLAVGLIIGLSAVLSFVSRAGLIPAKTPVRALQRAAGYSRVPAVSQDAPACVVCAGREQGEGRRPNGFAPNRHGVLSCRASVLKQVQSD